MSRGRVIFLGGNGHSAARLEPARSVLRGRAATFDVLDVAYPGFEGRPPAAGFEEFLDVVSDRVASAAGEEGALLYGTGIGGLLALCLRARGLFEGLPLLLQAPVLWGLERRWMPRLLRLLPPGAVLRTLFRSPLFQRRFARRHFTAAPDSAVLAGFFEGYARCWALPDLFAWMGPDLLRRLEAELDGRPGVLSGVSVWWGGRDRVVGVEELRVTERALGVAWPLRVFPHWGHYPMIDAPEDWIGALQEKLPAGIRR